MRWMRRKGGGREGGRVRGAMWMRARARRCGLGELARGVCGCGAGLFTPGAGALRLSSHPGAGGPTQSPGPLPLLSLPAPVVHSGQVRGRQQNQGALGAFLHRRPRTSRGLRSSALRCCSGDLPPRSHGCGRWGGRPAEYMKSLCGCEGAVPVAQCPAHSGLACAFLARGGTNAGRRVPARLPQVCSGET